MNTGIVRQAILDENNNAIGYEILYKEDDGSLFNRTDTVAANAIESFLTSFDSEKFLDGKTAYFTFTPTLLLKDIPSFFSVDKLVIQVEESSLIHPLAQKAIMHFHRLGYPIAVKGFEFNSRYFAILDATNIFKIDFADIKDEATVRNIIDIAYNLNKQVIAYNVNTPEALKKANELGCRFKQGTFIAETQSSQVNRLDHLQSNFFQLVIEVTKEDPDIDKITEIISRDVTLTFSLIKLVNSAYFALRNRVKSVKQALIVLGLNQLKQWIYLLSFRQNNNTPNELIRISFLRANFCSGLNEYIPDSPITNSEAYLLGMFSTLGVLLQTPLSVTLEELSVSDEIKNALLHGKGKSGALISLVRNYEKADWQGVTNYSCMLRIPYNLVSQKYIESVEHVNEIWNQLMIPYSSSND
ncbi:MAG: HDOD domain-containing protein [Clostridiales bacterium]|nr:HDOD domain-containing protein [Clostridiales bacterium]